MSGNNFKYRTTSLLLSGVLLVLLSAIAPRVPADAQTDPVGEAHPASANPETPADSAHVFLPLIQDTQVHLWLAPKEIAKLPTSGPAWNNLFAAAQHDTSNPDLSDQDDSTDVYVLAKALVYARTGEISYRQQVVQAIQAAIGTEAGARTLAIGRNLPALIIAADLVKLSATPQVDTQFRAWLAGLLTANLDGDTLRTTHELRPNNWGNHAGAARAAIAIYLGNRVELERVAQVFRGYLGDRDAYAGFRFGDLWWQCTPQKPVGINPPGCTIGGHSVDGVVTDDQRRAGPFQWPPAKENYAWEGLQGALLQAQLLHQAGYAAWEWEDRALLRAATWLHEQASYPAEGDDEWQPWLINAVYGTNFPTELPARPGKNVGWTDWTAPAMRP